MLTLPIKESWLRKIWRLEKMEEYRADNAYYDARLLRYRDQVMTLRLRAGYRMDAPAVVCAVIPRRRRMGRPEGGAPEKPCWVLVILGIQAFERRTGDAEQTDGEETEPDD